MDGPVIEPMTEAAFAQWRGEQGHRSTLHRGHHWTSLLPGFLVPLHGVGRLGVEEAVPPARPHWGFRAVLRDDEAAAATGSLPVHLMQDVADQDVDRLSANRRKHLRRCYRRVHFLALDRPDVLEQQGYAVVRSSIDRTRHQAAPTPAAYLAGLRGYTDAGRRLVVAGLIGADLGGYLAGYAVEGTAYFEDLYVATEALSTDITLGLIHEFVEACRRSGRVREIMNGLHARENPELDTFKESMGFPVVQLPTRVSIQPVARALLSARYPEKLYRLEGHRTHAAVSGRRRTRAARRRPA
jgi:hypothetical protein